MINAERLQCVVLSAFFGTLNFYMYLMSRLAGSHAVIKRVDKYAK